MTQIDVIKENVQYEQLLRESFNNTVLKGEYLIKDSHPDVQKILGVEAKARIISKEILADKVMIEGQINYSVLYLSEDESGIERVNSVDLTEKFADYLDLNSEEHKVFCDVECIMEHIQANIMNERKISIDGIRSTRWYIYKVGEFEFVKDLDGIGDIQIQKKKEEINQCKGEKEIELLGKSIIKVTMDKPEVSEVLKCSMNLHKKEVKIGEDKIYFGCYCKMEILYKGIESDEIVILQDDIYLSKEEELIGINSDMMASYTMEISNEDCIVTPDDLGENRVISAEFLAKGIVKVLSKEMVEVVDDAYSPTYPISLVKNNNEIGLVHGIFSNELILKENLYLKDENAKLGSVILAYGTPMIIEKTIEDNKIKIDGVIKVSALYRTSEDEIEIDMCNGEIPFNTTVDLKDAQDGMNIICKVNLESLDATIEANTIAVRATLALNIKTLYKVNKEWITEIIEEDEEDISTKPSLIIYVANKEDTLWNLAKKYKTTMKELISINDIDENESLLAGQKIIIPGKCIF